MRKTILLAALDLISLSALGKDKPKEEGPVFTTAEENPITSTKNQNRSSTHWSFSSLGFLESKLLRTGGGEYDPSGMFVVHHTMVNRATSYARYYGDSSFSPSGGFYDIMFCTKNYGLVPQEAMPGIMYGDSLLVHDELDATAGAYVNAITKGNLKRLTPVWKKGPCAIHDTYLGRCPENLTYKDKEYTPMTLAQSLGLNPDDYVSLTSYIHHPFYLQFVIEIQDNWRNGLSYNLPLDEFMAITDNAVRNGYMFAWDSGANEEGFARDGIAVMPDAAKGAELTDSDMARWTGMTAADKRKELTSKPPPEIKVTQEMRQTAFDNWETTDDHGMIIYGITKDQNGKEHFMMKNSWGTNNKYKGTRYASKALVAYRTMNILAYKDTPPKDIAKKLGIK